MSTYAIDAPIPDYPEAEKFLVLRLGLCTSFFAMTGGENYWFIGFWQYQREHPHVLTIQGGNAGFEWLRSVLPSLTLVESDTATISDADVVKIRLMTAS